MSKLAEDIITKIMLSKAGYRALSAEDVTDYARLVDEELESRFIVPMLLWCPECGARHIDEGEFATKKHHTHACQNCGHCWRPAIIATCGVQFLPGFKNEATT